MAGVLAAIKLREVRSTASSTAEVVGASRHPPANPTRPTSSSPPQVSHHPRCPRHQGPRRVGGQRVPQRPLGPQRPAGWCAGRWRHELVGTTTCFRYHGSRSVAPTNTPPTAATVSISATTLATIVADTTQSLAQQNTAGLIVVNGHGGNAVLTNVVQRVNQSTTPIPQPRSLDRGPHRRRNRQ
ncbi:creatininase family protein [Mycobacterium attenuatum]|uniref:creatininase family protein n=1 Tax=Mycobacterium attenuatum TaxID=2341086 RepID=UPI001FCEC8D6|nr:creatininase family protein [Mycobacterium attenuatum]